MRVTYLICALALSLLCVSTLLSTAPVSAWPVEVATQADASSSQGMHLTYLPLVRKAYPIYLPPGTHTINRCMRVTISSNTFAGVVDECVTTVTIQADGYMKFGFSWTAYFPPSVPYITKYSDAGNRNMYITDNAGHRYDHVQVGGAAHGAWLFNGETKGGWFLFPPAERDATTFAFYDDDHGEVITDIVLVP
jgi:hypothetical protein